MTRYGLAAAGLMIGLLARGDGIESQAQPKAPPAPAPPAAEPARQGQPEWASFPLMLLEKVYRGPLRDTIIQRWRDPIDGSVCFLYIPISTPLLPPPAEGYVQYGPNQIGSISCIHPTQVLQMWEGENPPPVPAPARKRPGP